MNKLASALTGLEGERVALCDVSVSAVLQDLLAEVTVSQTYRNDERVNIEAVYTFPLPLDAVLLELEVEIGGRVLKGVVVEKKAAEEKYEDAVEAGDAAVMLEAIEPGLFTMNVGNLLPQETAKITFRYAILYRWAGDRLRFFLPTTIAPRFGESPHLPHQAPEASLTVENQFSLRVEVLGALRDAQFVCPSHAVELVKSAESVVLSLRQPKAVMDRDFILNVKAPQATRSFVLCGQDGDGLAAVASFQPFFPGLQQPRPLNLAIVIDCSGSMQGDSMEQAKQALEGILDGLQPHDRIALIAFGNSTNVLSDRPLPCNKTNLAKAKRFAKALDANMGGTEIGNALREAYAVAGRSESADVFLVTDGEVSDWETVVDEAKKSGHRIFTVGVGSAVSEAFVRELAAGTGGVCELVSPREGMADRVVRHFERMRAPRAKRVAVRWPDGAANITPARIGAVFEGDTVVACARFDRAPAHGAAILEVETDKGETVRQELAFPATT
ncbi:MAG TPA: VIT and VWA domain-containing protein, partial [Thauera aminoaromatica]|nr:VIT and VWA domain-containing protein [Thauera aminoaromatica]